LLSRRGIGNRGAEFEFDLNVFEGQQGQKVREKEHGTPEADAVFRVMTWFPVAEVTRGDRALSGFGGREKRRVEIKDPAPFGAGALGEDDHPLTGLERGGHLSADASDIGAAVAPDVKRAGPGALGDDDGPVADLAFADEESGSHGRDRHDIEIAEVVGRDETGFRNLAMMTNAEVEDLGKAPGARLHPVLTVLGADRATTPQPEVVERRGEDEARETA